MFIFIWTSLVYVYGKTSTVTSCHIPLPSPLGQDRRDIGAEVLHACQGKCSISAPIDVPRPVCGDISGKLPFSSHAPLMWAKMAISQLQIEIEPSVWFTERFFRELSGFANLVARAILPWQPRVQTRSNPPRNSCFWFVIQTNLMGFHISVNVHHAEVSQFYPKKLK